VRKINIGLLFKWWWALKNEEVLRQDLVKLKYVKKTPICMIPNRIDDSPIWKDLMKVKCIYLKRRDYKVNSGKK
jgi:hypothetical protein